MKWEKGFNAHLPLKDDDELPRSGVEDDQKEGTELLKAGDDEKPKAVLEANGEDGWATPVEEPPKPIGEPNGVVIPNGLRAKGLILELFCPKPDDDCPKTVERIIPIYQWFVKVTKNQINIIFSLHTHT